MDCVDRVIEALEEYYRDNALGRTMEYTFGYFDALAVVRALVGANAPVREIGQIKK